MLLSWLIVVLTANKVVNSSFSSFLIFIFFEQKPIQFGFGVALFNLLKHGVSQNKTPHLRKQNYQKLLGLKPVILIFAFAVKKRKNPADKCADVPIHLALKIYIHCNIAVFVG